MKLKYKRILLKLSGEVFGGKKEHGIEPAVLTQIAGEIAAIHRAGVQVGIVIGGGNIYRGASDTTAIGRTTGDVMGMLATAINSLALKEYLAQQKVDCCVYSSLRIDKAADLFVAERAIADLTTGRIVIIAGGTGNPYFTTDTAAALRCAELKAEVLLKATKVDGVYDSDPFKNPSAHRFKTIGYAEALSRNLKVMDATAFSFCHENNIPIIVFKLMEPGNLRKCVQGLPVGSLVKEVEP